MFDIGFLELLVISVLALLVLGPERLPGAIRSCLTTIRSIKQMANGFKEEISSQLDTHELHESLKKAEKMGMENISPELKASVDELKAAAESVQRPYKTKKPQQTQSDDALDDKSVKAAVGSPDTPHAPDSEHSIEVNSILPPQTADKKD